MQEGRRGGVVIIIRTFFRSRGNFPIFPQDTTLPPLKTSPSISIKVKVNHNNHHKVYIFFNVSPNVCSSTSKIHASLVRQIVALEGGNDGQSCHSLSDSVAWHSTHPHLPTAPDHPVPPVSGQRLADPPKVPSKPLQASHERSSIPPLASQRGQISSGAEQSGSGP